MEATPGKTAAVAIACYLHSQWESTTSLFRQSAAKHGIPIHFFGVGESYVNHFDAKVRRLSTWIDSLPLDYTHVLYADAADSVCQAPLDLVCTAFNAIPSPVVVTSDCECWPRICPQWSAAGRPHPTGNRYVNAGGFMGRRTDLREALDNLARLQVSLFRDHPEYRGQQLERGDQLLWEWLARESPAVCLDHACQIFSVVSTRDRRIGKHNRDYIFHDGRVWFRPTGECPPVLHFAGNGRACVRQWAAYLGVG